MVQRYLCTFFNQLIIPRFEHTWTAVQRTLTAHWIICLNPLISSRSNHSSLSMVKPYGGVKRLIQLFSTEQGDSFL